MRFWRNVHPVRQKKKAGKECRSLVEQFVPADGADDIKK